MNAISANTTQPEKQRPEAQDEPVSNKAKSAKKRNGKSQEAAERLLIPSTKKTKGKKKPGYKIGPVAGYFHHHHLLVLIPPQQTLS